MLIRKSQLQLPSRKLILRLLSLPAQGLMAHTRRRRSRYQMQVPGPTPHLCRPGGLNPYCSATPN